jgi:hypothetical protein
LEAPKEATSQQQADGEGIQVFAAWGHNGFSPEDNVFP